MHHASIFASSSATVVVGTVIDQDMGEELKVTVVATGLGEEEIPTVIVDNTVAQQALDGQVDYAQLDRPAFARNQPAVARDNLPEEQESQDLDYLDIPAFLRRQAD